MHRIWLDACNNLNNGCRLPVCAEEMSLKPGQVLTLGATEHDVTPVHIRLFQGGLLRVA